MKADTLALLCRPGTREPLRLESTPGSGGLPQQVLVGVETGERFLIRDGIPILLNDSKIEGFNRRYRNFYNRIAAVYDAGMWLFARVAGGGEEHFRRQYLRQLHIPEGGRLLEVSIGTGGNVRYLPATVDCYGLDLSWAMLRQCQKNLRRWHKQAELVLGNAEELPFHDESFDAILHVGGINAFDDRSQAIREMIRVARAGAEVMIVDETVQMLESLSWAPTARRWLEQHRERFSAPVALVPAGMRQVAVAEIARGNMYCLTFRKP